MQMLRGMLLTLFIIGIFMGMIAVITTIIIFTGQFLVKWRMRNDKRRKDKRNISKY